MSRLNELVKETKLNLLKDEQLHAAQCEAKELKCQCLQLKKEAGEMSRTIDDLQNYIAYILSSNAGAGSHRNSPKPVLNGVNTSISLAKP